MLKRSLVKWFESYELSTVSVLSSTGNNILSHVENNRPTVENSQFLLTILAENAFRYIIIMNPADLQY